MLIVMVRASVTAHPPLPTTWATPVPDSLFAADGPPSPPASGSSEGPGALQPPHRTCHRPRAHASRPFPRPASHSGPLRPPRPGPSDEPAASKQGGSPPRLPPSGRPFQAALLPDIQEADQEDPEEEDHFHQPEKSQAIQDNRPGIQEHDLDVEDNEQHRDQVELDREPLSGAAHRIDPALVRGEFILGRQPGPP